MVDYIVIGIVVVILALAVISVARRIKGKGRGCCGSGSGTIRENKKLQEPILGEKIVHIEGMHCENCQNRIERAVNKLDGVACRVNLRKKIATITYNREISEEELIIVIEDLDFEVISIDSIH